MGDPEGNDGNNEGGHGFLSEAWEGALKVAGKVDDRVSQGLDVGSGIVKTIAGQRALGTEFKELSGLANEWGGATAASTAGGQLSFGDMFASEAKAIENPSALQMLNKGSELAEDGELGGSLGKALPGIGTALSVASTGISALQMANDVKRDGGFANAYHDQEFYNHAGGTALGAAHTILPYIPVYGESANLALTAGELTADAGGWAAKGLFGDKAGFNAESVAGGLVRGMYGDQSLGEQARQGVTGLLGHGALGNGVGIAADVLTNSAAMPVNLAMTVGRGVWNEGGAIVDGIANGQGLVGKGVKGAEQLASAGWNEAKSLGSGAVNTAKNLASGAGNAISSGVKSVLSW